LINHRPVEHRFGTHGECKLALLGISVAEFEASHFDEQPIEPVPAEQMDAPQERAGLAQPLPCHGKSQPREAMEVGRAREGLSEAGDASLAGSRFGEGR